MSIFPLSCVREARRSVEEEVQRQADEGTATHRRRWPHSPHSVVNFVSGDLRFTRDADCICVLVKKAVVAFALAENPDCVLYELVYEGRIVFAPSADDARLGNLLAAHLTQVTGVQAA